MPGPNMHAMDAKSTTAIPMALTAAVLLLASGLAAYRSHAAVIVGRQRPAEIQQPAAASPTLDQMKAEYRRPETIPFPSTNPYTPEKAFLGKKLYFDTRLSSGNLLSCA